MGSSSSRNRSSSRNNPRNPKYSPRGRRTAQSEKRRRRRRPTRFQLRQGGQWIGIRAANQIAGGAIKFIFFPVIFPIRKFQQRRNKASR